MYTLYTNIFLSIILSKPSSFNVLIICLYNRRSAEIHDYLRNSETRRQTCCWVCRQSGSDVRRIITFYQIVR